MKSSTQPIIDDIYFVPMKRKATFVGYLSFRYNEFACKGTEVHETGVVGKYRLVYPKQQVIKDGKLLRETKLMYPIGHEAAALVDAAISEYLNTNWDKEARIVRNQRKIPKKGSTNAKPIPIKEVEGADGRTRKEGEF